MVLGVDSLYGEVGVLRTLDSVDVFKRYDCLDAVWRGDDDEVLIVDDQVLLFLLDEPVDSVDYIGEEPSLDQFDVLFVDVLYHIGSTEDV